MEWRAYVALALGLATGTRGMNAQSISFYRHFTTPTMDRATAVAADASAVYVAGIKPGPGGAASALRKYDSFGNELWTRDFEGPAVQPFRLASVTAGLYMLGYGEGASPVLLRKYDPDGNHVWTREVDIPVRALTADDGGAYVAGGNYQSAFLRKYTSDGVELWTKQFGEMQTATGVALDMTGVYVQVSYSNGEAGEIIRKYDPAGNELWVRELSGSDVHRAFSAAYPSGLYVIAEDARGSGTYLRRYDSDGGETWSRRIYAVPDNPGLDVAVDSTGVYVAGQVPAEYAPYRPYGALPGQCRSGSGGDSFVKKYDAGGLEIWTRQFGTTDATWASGVAVNESGVYVTGQEGTALVRDDTEHVAAFAPANPSRNAFLAKLEKAADEVSSTAPRIIPDCVVNAASYVGGGVAPGEIVTIFGSAMGPSEPVQLSLTEDPGLATVVSGTRVLFDSVPAPLVYVSDRQATAIVPSNLEGRTSVDVQVEYQGSRSDAVRVPVLPSRPGIFTADSSGWGQALISNEDGSLNSPSNPARRGSVVTLYATGGGETITAPGASDVLPETSLPVSVFFDLTDNEFQEPSKAAEILYAGAVQRAPAGLLQIRMRVPGTVVRTGKAVPFLFIIGSHWTVYQASIALQ